MGHVEQPGAGYTAPWLRLTSLPGRQRRIMIDNCVGASVFPRGYDDNAVDDPDVQLVRRIG